MKSLFLHLHFSGGNVSWKCDDLVNSLIDSSVIHKDKTEFHHFETLLLVPVILVCFAASESGSIMKNGVGLFNESVRLICMCGDYETPMGVARVLPPRAEVSNSRQNGRKMVIKLKKDFLPSASTEL